MSKNRWISLGCAAVLAVGIAIPQPVYALGQPMATPMSTTSVDMPVKFSSPEMGK